MKQIKKACEFIKKKKKIRGSNLYPPTIKKKNASLVTKRKNNREPFPKGKNTLRVHLPQLRQFIIRREVSQSNSNP